MLATHLRDHAVRQQPIHHHHVLLQQCGDVRTREGSLAWQAGAAALVGLQCLLSRLLLRLEHHVCVAHA